MECDQIRKDGRLLFEVVYLPCNINEKSQRGSFVSLNPKLS